MSVRRAPAAPAVGPATAVSHQARLAASLRSMPAPVKDVSVAFSDFRRVLKWTEQRKEFQDEEWNRLYLLKALVAKNEHKFGGMSQDKVNAMIVQSLDMDDVLTVNDPAYDGDPTVDKIIAAAQAEGALQAEEREAARYLRKARRQKREDDEAVMTTCKSGGKCTLDLMSTRGAQREQKEGGQTYDQMYPPADIKAAEELVRRGKTRRAEPAGGLWGSE